jgi:hypothetical protein
MYIGGDPGAREDGGRFDLPPHQIRIKSSVLDSELPNLAFEFNKRELSFEWERMFTQIFLESTMLAKAQSKIMAESMQWYEEGDLTIVGALAHKKKRSEALRNAAKTVRRHRIKRFYLDNHNYEFKDHLFDEEAEDMALEAIQDHELHGDFTRCAEDNEAEERAKAHVESQDMFDFMETMRGINGVREDDENGLMTMLMKLIGVNGPPGDENAEDEDDDEDDADASEEEYIVDDEWTDWTPNA